MNRTRTFNHKVFYCFKHCRNVQLGEVPLQIGVRLFFGYLDGPIIFIQQEKINEINH